MNTPTTVSNATDAMPGWLKGAMLLGNTFGIPVLILAFYMAQDAGILKNPVAEQLEELKGVVIQQQLAVEKLVEQGKKEEESRTMRCVLRAQNEAEKRACFPGNKE